MVLLKVLGVLLLLAGLAWAPFWLALRRDLSRMPGKATPTEKGGAPRWWDREPPVWVKVVLNPYVITIVWMPFIVLTLLSLLASALVLRWWWGDLALLLFLVGIVASFVFPRIDEGWRSLMVGALLLAWLGVVLASPAFHQWQNQMSWPPIADGPASEIGWALVGASVIGTFLVIAEARLEAQRRRSNSAERSCPVG